MSRKLKIGLYPGTFDPITNGHLDIISRASVLFDRIIVAVAESTSKSTLFSAEERLDLLKRSIKKKDFSCPIQIESFNGLIVEFARQKKAAALVRGLRAVSDFEYEFQMALMNRHQQPRIETVFLMPDEKFVYLSSSLVKIIAKYRGKLGAFLPKPVIQALKARVLI